MERTRFWAILFSVSLLSSVPVLAQTRQERDGITQSAPPEDANYSERQSVPGMLTLPPGTLVSVRTTQPLSSAHNRAGDNFTTVLDQAVIAQGWVVARPGQTVLGRVVTAQKTGRTNASSQLAVELRELSLVDGQPVPIETELVEIGNGNSSRLRNEGAVVGATTGTGAVIGAIAGGGPGAAIGAAIGAAAGVAGVLSTRGRETEIEPETILTFRLRSPVTISTDQSRQAFLPVRPGDYGRRADRNPDRYPVTRTYPREPRRYYAPYDWYPAPYSYFSFYGYWGPRYYAAPRIYAAPGFRRRYR